MGKDKLFMVGNWAMAGTAAITAIYVIHFMFSPMPSAPWVATQMAVTPDLSQASQIVAYSAIPVRQPQTLAPSTAYTSTAYTSTAYNGAAVTRPIITTGSNPGSNQGVGSQSLVPRDRGADFVIAPSGPAVPSELKKWHPELGNF